MPTSVESLDASGYLNGRYTEEGMDEDGFFTCAVSVQHKKHETETVSQTREEELGRKVVWPAEQSRLIKKAIESNKCFQKTMKSEGSVQVDHPHYWLNKQEDDQSQAAPARVSRSRSRSKNIMERARSFERGAAMQEADQHQQAHISRPVSRSGSFRNRSASGTRNNAMENNWNQLMDRPGSRTDVDSRRFMEVGRVNTQCWENRIHGSTEYIPPRTPPPPRKDMQIMKQYREDVDEGAGTPEPPPPPARMHQMPKQEQMFPPPPCSAGSKLSEESVNMLSQDNKERSVLEWVHSTTQSRDEIQKELEKFAYDIAESVVSTMEKNSEKSCSKQDLSVAVENQQMPSHLVNQFWERQMSIPESQLSSSSSSNNQASIPAVSATTTNCTHSSTPQVTLQTCQQLPQVAAPERTSGIFHAVPARTSQQLHGPVYIQDQTPRGQMTFQQEERRRQELRIKEEKVQEEKRRAEIMEQERLRIEEESRRQEEEKRRFIEEQRRQENMKREHEEVLRLEEKRKFEEEQRRKEELRRFEEKKKIEEEQRKREEQKRLEEERMRQEEERKRQEEERRIQILRRQEEEKRIEAMRREEERRRMEEEKRKIEEEKRIEAEEKRKKEEMERKRREEQERYEKLRREEEACRREEMRLEQELRRQYELQQQKLTEEETIKKEQAAQKEINVREHIPKINKFRAFDNSQDRLNEVGKEREHLGKVKTGQVNDKRNFWIRSTSAERSGNQGLSPAPRRKRINTWSKQKDAAQEESESRPGSSMGQPGNSSVKNITNGFLSKSRSTAAVMQEAERGRPPSRTRHEVAWTKEKYDENTNNQNFLKCQDVKTNKVNETISSWGKHDDNTAGRVTPVPSRNIGQVFSDNKVAKAENEKHANSWRTKTPEPSVKLMNVHVEKSIGSSQNIHISESAHAQLAEFVQETKTTGHQEFSSSTTSSSSQTTMQTTSTMSQQSATKEQYTMSSQQSVTTEVSQPPQAPERNQSIGGKSSACYIQSEQSGCQFNTKNKLESVLCERTDTPQSNQVLNLPSSNTNISKQDKKQFITHSASAQSINSTLSTCSSGKIPLPIKNSWFDDDQMTSAASSYSNIPGSLLSPTGRTPIPVSAQWFTHSDLEKSFSENIKHINSFASIKSVSSEKNDNSDHAGTTDDIDSKSVKSDTTVIENYERTCTPAPIIPPRPVELKRPYSPPPIPKHNDEYTDDNNANTRQKFNKPDLIPTHTEYNSNQNKSRLSTYENVCNIEPIHETKTFLTEHTDMLSIQSATSSFCSTADRDSIKTDITVTEKSQLTSNDDNISKHSSSNDQTFADLDKLISGQNETVVTNQDSNNKPVHVCANVNASKAESDSQSEAKDSSCIITVPQSPKEIRKKFQENGHAQRKFQKSADLELSHEFREGIRGKVRESKQSFLASTNSDKFIEAKEQRAMELKQIRLQRSESKTRCDDGDETIETLGDKMRQEKLRELQNMQKSRFDSKNLEETISSSTYNELKRERQQELATLANRKIDLEDAAFFSPTELREHQLREEREKELAALCARSYMVDTETEQSEQQCSIEELRESGSYESNQGIVEVPESPKPTLTRKASALSLPSATIQDLTRELDALTDEAFEVLDSSRQKSIEPEMDVKSLREKKSIWLNKESTSRVSAERSNSNTPTPSRRIGSMFRKDSEYWSLDDDLPAPPPGQEPLHGSTHPQQIQPPQCTEDPNLPPPPNSDSTEVHPPPPPRQSSRGKVDEYRSWSGAWKSGSSFGHQN